MLQARKSAWFEKIFAVYNRNLLRRRFASFKVSGLENLSDGSAANPLLIYANHPSWWDGLLAFEISRRARLDSFVMMEEAQLRRFFLFRRVGAFSVSPTRRGAVESINYAAELLRANPQRAVWIFPQGEIVPNDARPVRFFNGAARIVERAKKCSTVPIGLRLDFGEKFKPEIFVKIGAPRLIEAAENFDSKSLTAEFAETMTEILDELKADAANKRLGNYREIL